MPKYGHQAHENWKITGKFSFGKKESRVTGVVMTLEHMIFVATGRWEQQRNMDHKLLISEPQSCKALPAARVCTVTSPRDCGHLQHYVWAILIGQRVLNSKVIQFICQ